jgi:hypothetical protein
MIVAELSNNHGTNYYNYFFGGFLMKKFYALLFVAMIALVVAPVLNAADTAKPADTKTTVAADKKADDKKPADKKPADKKPADKKAADKKPADKKAADKKPADKKAADEKPADAKAAK